MVGRAALNRLIEVRILVPQVGCPVQTLWLTIYRIGSSRMKSTFYIWVIGSSENYSYLKLSIEAFFVVIFQSTSNIED